jgi:hypothetical protein
VIEYLSGFFWGIGDVDALLVASAQAAGEDWDWEK